MLTRIDHVMICVPNLEQGIEQYRAGFHMYPGGVHTGKGTHNAIAFNQEDYIELLGIRDQAEHQATSPPGSADADCPTSSARRRHSLHHRAERRPGRRRRRNARARRRRQRCDRRAAAHAGRSGAALEARRPRPGESAADLLHRARDAARERRRSSPRGQASERRLRIERAYIAVPDAKTAAATYARVLGCPSPPMQRAP